MKIAFISDIHGNAVALEAVLADISKKQVEKVYVLGDICYRGPQPKRSLDLVRSLHTEVVKGNADEWVVRGVKLGEVPDPVLGVMNMERDWTVSQLAGSDIEYLDSLPREINVEVEGVSFHLFHATPDSLFDIILPNADDETLQTKMMSAVEANLYVYAHIHKPYIRFMKGKVIMNIGSVGLPFDGLNKASYGIVEVTEDGFRTSIERVSFDLEKVVRQYKDVDYPNADMMIQILRNAGV
jgi:putative phosphoesterase